MDDMDNINHVITQLIYAMSANYEGNFAKALVNAVDADFKRREECTKAMESPEVLEYVELSEYSDIYEGGFPIVQGIYSLAGEKYLKRSTANANHLALCTVFNAGRIYGIRQERARRRRGIVKY